ncbi:glycosyltransferase family 4 protein [Prosthecobacter sp.]|uniref:glycosyltransferase family 4 protein n=1 Tax=Prosthecobacter sp. TaxID=1965333 RepID=UPI003783003E
MPKILHVAPVMPVDEHHIEYALDKAGQPGSLVTSWIPTPLEHGLLRMIPALRRGLRREPVRLRRRWVERHFWPDMRRSLEMMLGVHQSVILAHDAFFERVDRHAERQVSPETRIVIGREFGCRHVFRRASRMGASCVYHLPTVHHETLYRILQSEGAQYPGVCRSTFDPFEFQPRRLRYKLEEIALADVILCPSQFVRQTLLDAGVDGARISVTPFGSETTWLDAPRAEASSKTVVFVGNISARKGAHRLLQVWKQLGAYKTHKLLLVGEMHLSASFLQDYAGLYEHRPRLPREDLRDIYLKADALVLPALAEGFALVIQEALSCGTPVLASLHSGAAGFVTDEQARLFAAQDNDALASALEWGLSQPTALAEMGRAGRRRVQEWTWRSFETLISQRIETLLAATHSSR